MSKSNQFWLCELILLSVSLIHRYILQDSLNYQFLTKTLCHNDVMFYLHELCNSHTKKNVLLKFLGKKLDWEAKRICWEYRRKDGLLVLWMTFYDKLTKLVQSNEQLVYRQWTCTVCPNASEYLACFWADAVNRTILVITKRGSFYWPSLYITKTPKNGREYAVSSQNQR